MNIYPQDLGSRYEAKVLSLRGRVGEAGLASEARTDNDGFWIGTSIVAAMLVLGTLLHSGLAAAGGVLVVVVAIMYYLGSVHPRRTFNRLHGRLMVSEISEIWAGRENMLEAKFLSLVQTAIELPVAGDQAAEGNVREAVRALGTAIEDLPAPVEASSVKARLPLRTALADLPAPGPELISDDPEALKAEAARLTSQAQAETDSVIAASLWRRADSLARRAETAARTLMLLRRNQALRDEVAEQIDALRTSLTAFRVGGRQSATELADLAASIHRVALEANAITTARAEIDTLLNLPQIIETSPEAQAQPLRRSNE